MKNFLLPLLLIVVLTSCKKEYSTYTEPGTTQTDTSTVKRLVMVEGADSVAFDFTYDPSSKRLIYLNITEVYTGNEYHSSDTFFRDPVSGNIQRSVFTIYDPNSSVYNYYDTTYYQYFPDGKLQSRLRSQEFSPGYKDSIVLIYASGKLKEEVRYSKGPSTVSFERKRIFDIGINDRINGISDSAYSETLGLFEWVSSDFFLYVDTIDNPLRLNVKEDREVLGFDYYSFNDYPWLNLFSPKVLKKQTYQSSYSSGILTFDFSSYQLQAGRPVLAQVTKTFPGGSAAIEVRYYYSD
ncbi:MAG: hypothetical protein ACKO6K_11245 [Chitinophagaceae bacterium]